MIKFVIISSFMFITLIPMPTMASLDLAMKAYKEMKIALASELLMNSKIIPEELMSIEQLKSGLIFNKNLKIYRDIYTKALDTQTIYLTTLTDDKNENTSQTASLFLAESLILGNQLNKAENYLNNYLSHGSNKYLTTISKLNLAWIALLKKNDEKYQSIVNRMDKNNIFIQMAIAAINLRVGNSVKFNTANIRLIEKQFLQNNRFNSVRFANYAMILYLHNNEIFKARDIAIRLNQSQPSYIEKVTDYKEVRFYQPDLINTISELHYQLAKYYFNLTKKDRKYHDMAIFYLSELELTIANDLSSAELKKKLNQLNRLPKSISSLVPIRKSAHGYLNGKTTLAFRIWKDSLNNVKNDPLMAADVVLMCLYLDANCPTIVQNAQKKAENGRSSRFVGLNTNVGRYFMRKKLTNKAMRLLDNALDRAKNNGLLENEPMLLLNLAEVYRLNQRYAKSLQIFFSLGENFPIIRQIQDAVQGEYLYRQRSSGENNVF